MNIADFEGNNDFFIPSPKKLKQIQNIKNQMFLVDQWSKSVDPNDVIPIKFLPLMEVGFDLLEKTMKNRCTSNGLEVFDIDYASKISSRTRVSPYCFMLALIYIERLQKTNPNFFYQVSPCEMFLVAMMVASKFLYDEGEEQEVLNDKWAAISSTKLRYLNNLEREFLAAIEWNVFVNNSSFYLKMVDIVLSVINNECRKRSWSGLTYNEMIVLLDLQLYGENFMLLSNTLVPILHGIKSQDSDWLLYIVTKERYSFDFSHRLQPSLKTLANTKH